MFAVNIDELEPEMLTGNVEFFIVQKHALNYECLLKHFTHLLRACFCTTRSIL